MFKKFWNWYEDNQKLNLGLAAFLFSLQIIHLIWLFGDVVYFRIFGQELFGLERFKFISLLILVVDYLEIPAIATTSLVYINELRKNKNIKSLLFLIFINSQWLHLLWITDEFVVDTFTGLQTNTYFPFWLAWTAILIDYLELPVIIDTLKKFFNSLGKGDLKLAFEELKEK